MKLIYISLFILELLIMIKCWQVVKHALDSYGWEEFDKYMLGWIFGVSSFIAVAFTLSAIIN